MKKRLVILFSVLVMVICLAFSVTACKKDNVESGTSGLEYTLLDDDTYSVSGGTTQDLTNIIIPATHGGKAVTKIADEGFSQFENLTHIVIPNSVTSIGKRAFYACRNIMYIEIPDSVTSIENEAFVLCYRLVEVYNKSNLEIVKGSTENGYAGYYALAIYTEEYTSKLSTDQNGYTFYIDGEEKVLVRYTGNTANLTLLTDVTGINRHAFNSNENLTNVGIPVGVEWIGDGAFSSCKNLQEVTLPNGLLTIGDNAFSNCESLTEIVIPDGVTSIGDRAFWFCQKLKTIVFPDSVTSIGMEVCAYTSYYDNAKNWKNQALYVGKHLLALQEDCWGVFTIEEGTLTIADRTFFNSRITTISIPESVKTIGKSAFEDSDLMDVNISSGLTVIGDKAFSRCKYLENFVIPDSVTTIGKQAFLGSGISENIPMGSGYGMTSLTIGSGVKSIDDQAFSNCLRLKTIMFNGTVQEWNAIRKGTNLFYKTQVTEIVCTDETITL